MKPELPAGCRFYFGRKHAPGNLFAVSSGLLRDHLRSGLIHAQGRLCLEPAAPDQASSPDARLLSALAELAQFLTGNFEPHPLLRGLFDRFDGHRLVLPAIHGSEC